MAVLHFEAVVKRMNNVGQSLDDMETVITGITYKVLTIDTNTAATLYDENGTAKTNPVTTTVFAVDDQIDFYCDAALVDLIVVDTEGGFTAFVENFSPNQRAIVIDERPNIQHHGCIWFGPSTSATDTGVNFLPVTAIQDVWVEVVTVDATETVSVGTADTATGFRNLVSVATAGFPIDTAFITGGTNIDFIPVTTYGALLRTAVTGSDAVVSQGGSTNIGPHWVTTAGTDDDLYYTGSAGSDTQAGYLHYFFIRCR